MLSEKKITLEVRSDRSADVDAPLERWRPDASDDVYINVEVEVGEAGTGGADVFQILVATPDGSTRTTSGR